MRKIVKVINIIIIALLFLAIISSFSLAAGLQPSNLTGNKQFDTTEIQSTGNTIIKITRAIGTVISVGVLIILGIKYIMSSPEAKADYKGAMVPYVVGAILLFGATWICTAIYQFATGIKLTN